MNLVYLEFDIEMESILLSVLEDIYMKNCHIP